MTPEKVRSMVAAMQASGEDDAAIKAALDLARSQEQGAPPQAARMAEGVKQKRAKVAALEAEPDPMSIGEIAKNIPQTMSGLAGRFMNGITFGGADAIRRRVMGEDKFKAQKDWEEQPLRDAGMLGDVAGGLMGQTGGGIVAGPLGSGLGGMIEQKIPALAQSALGRVASNAAVGAGVGATSGAAQAGFEQGPEAMGRGALQGGLVGGVLGGGLSAVGEGAGAVNNAVRSSAGGQARQRLEARGANVGPLDSGSGGVFDNELAGLKPDDRGIGQASRRAASGVLKGLDEDYFENVAKPHSANRAAIENSPAGEATRDVTPIYSQLVKVYDSERLTPGERSQVRGILDRMDKYIGEKDGKLGLYMSETDLNDFRGMLQDVSKTGSPGNPTVAQSKMQKVAHTTKEAVDQGPYAETNKAFSEGRSAYEDKRNLLDLPAKPANYLDPAREAPEGGREPEVAKLANMLARDEQNTVTAGIRNSDRLAQFAAQNPEYADMLQLPRLMEDKANLKFRLGSPGHGGLIARIKHEGVPAAALYGLSELLTHNPKVSAGVAVGTHLLRTNAAPIAGRLLYGPAQEAANVGRASPVALPGFVPEIEQAYADWQRRQQERQ